MQKYSKKYGYKKEDIAVQKIGPRPGEKIYEELMTESEAQVAYETDDMLIIPPQIELSNISFGVKDYHNARQSTLKRYISKEVRPLSKKMIATILED